MKTTAKVDEFVRVRNASAMDRMIAAFRQSDVSDEEIAYLALRLADSGERLRHTENLPIADVPSTGGPSSLSTLLSPLALVLAGAVVPKLGVPGRPAGGIDSLACIPHFNPFLATSDVHRCLGACGYAHFMAGESFAPLDSILFGHRRSIGAINVPSLAIASLLSKKVAVGVNHVTLDVRVAPHANFGSTWEEARENAHRFIRVAGFLGIEAVCWLTDASMPYQPFVGRGESLVALASVFSGQPGEDLAAHVSLCTDMANSCLGTDVAPHPRELQSVFRNHLEQQAATWEGFASKVRDIESQPTALLTAESDGYFSVDLDLIRTTLVGRQDEAQSAGVRFADPCGLTILQRCGAAVNRGQALARVRSSENIGQLVTALNRAMLQSTSAPTRHPPEQVRANHV